MGILKYVEIAKMILPAIDKIVSELKVLVPAEKADIQAAVAAIEKAFSDGKAGFEALVEAVKTN